MGGGEFSFEEKKLFESLKIEDFIIQISVSDEELPFYYQNSLGFFFPSKYEGFGLPILEAFKNNCPCVLNEIEVFKEIAKDAAIYFDPNSKESINKSINKLKNNHIRNEYIKRGKNIVKIYDFEITLSKYRSLILNLAT